MPDIYHVPAMVLTALLLPAFGYLYHRNRSTRTLLWLLGFLFSMSSMLLRYPLGSHASFSERGPWMAAAGQSAFLIGTAMFLASLSPRGFRVGRLRVLYVVPYTIPLVIYSVLLFGVYQGQPSHWSLVVLFPTLGALSLTVALAWGAVPYLMPRWLSIAGCALVGAAGYWVFWDHGAVRALILAGNANLLITALLVLFGFWRLSPGVVLTVAGFAAWSLPAVRVLSDVAFDPRSEAHLLQVVVMSKVVAAMGMILLALEEEVSANQAAGEREHRARKELEVYTRLILSRRRVQDFDQQGPEICQAVCTHSRFSQVALLLHGGGRLRLAGSAGLDPAIAKALDELAARLPATGFLAPGSAPPAAEGSHTFVLDLEPWLLPGDDLKRLGLTSVLAVPMVNRSVIEGALLLSGIRSRISHRPPGTPPDPLRPDDLLPIEMLAARVQATRSQTMMFEKLIDSEKFGHLGQLAGSVTQQLNSPLTVILGYASLLEDTAELEPRDRKAVESILTEARHMRGTLESLGRIAGPQSDGMTAVSIAELLSDLGELHRPEFLERLIEFRLSLAPNLPRALCSAQQLRQAVRHCLQFSMEAVTSPGSTRDNARVIRLEAASEGGLVQILVAHSGPWFMSPERAFDPFLPPQNGHDPAGMGLSLCATILRDNDGRASAINLEPHGAAILLELKSA